MAMASSAGVFARTSGPMGRLTRSQSLLGGAGGRNQLAHADSFLPAQPIIAHVVHGMLVAQTQPSGSNMVASA